MTKRRIGVLLVVCALLVVPAAGHVPGFAEENTSPERALEVGDAAKSWSFYDSLDDGQARYYRFSLQAGQQLRVSTFTPAEGEFTPSVVVMSESFEGDVSVPPQVSVPEGMGSEVVTGARPASANYEPFAPSAFYETTFIDRTVERDTTYLVAVYDAENRTGAVGVAIGYREAFSPVEYLTVPFDLVQTHLWEGQSPLLVVSPWLATLLGGAVLVRKRRSETWEQPLVRYVLAGAALLVVGTGVSALLQMGLALAKTGLVASALVTAMFVVVPLVTGGWVLAVALRTGWSPGRSTRVGLLLAGAMSLFAWAGFIVGPVVFIAAAVLPTAWLE